MHPGCILGSALLFLLAPLWTSWSNLFMTLSSAGPLPCMLSCTGCQAGPKFQRHSTSLLQKRQLGEGRRTAVRCQTARAGASSLWGERAQALTLSCDVCSAGVEALHASSALHSGCCSHCCSADEDRHPGVLAKGTQVRGAWRLDPSLLTRGPMGAASQLPWVQGCLERE